MSEYPYDDPSGEVPPEEPVAPDPYVEEPVVAEPPPPPPPPAPEPPPPPPVEAAPPPPPPPVEEPPPAPPLEAPPTPPVEAPAGDAGVQQSPVSPGQPGFEQEPPPEESGVEGQSPVRPGQPGSELEPPPEDPGVEDQSPIRRGQPGFEEEQPVDESGVDEQSPIRPGQPGFEEQPVDESGVDEQSPIRPGQPGFEEQPVDESGVDEQSPVRPGQPGFEEEPLDELVSEDQSPVRPGQPGFEEEPLDELVSEDQSPVRPGQPGFEEEPLDTLEGEPSDTETADELLEDDSAILTPPSLDPGFEFTGDMSCWCQPGLPEDWTEWTPPVEPAPSSFTDLGYSRDWGVVEPEWVSGGEEPFTVVPAAGPMTGVLGPGEAANVHWDHQGQTNYCGLYSVRSIISELYGEKIDVNEMVNRAAENRWLVYDDAGQVKGIRPSDLDDIFASYGVGSRNFGGPDNPQVSDEDAWRALNTALINNQRVVFGVDGGEFDRGGDEGQGIDMDHFVVVTGVDYERGIVTINDSARKAGLEVPLDVFFNSWRDSNFSMTTTDLSMPGDGTARPPVDGELDPSRPGATVIGTTVQAEPVGPEGGPEGPGDGSEGPGEGPEGPGHQGPQIIDPGPQGPGQIRDDNDVPTKETVGAEREITAQVPVSAPADPVPAAPIEVISEGVVRPMGAFIGDLAPGVEDIGNVGEAISKAFDLGMVDEKLSGALPEGILDGFSLDGGLEDIIEELLDSVDEALKELAFKISPLTVPTSATER